MNDRSDFHAFTLLAAGFVADNLNSEEAAEFQRLLSEHPAWISEVDALQEALAQVVDGVSGVDPPPHLPPALLQATQDSPQPDNLVPFPRRQRRSARVWQRLAGGMAVLGVITLGVNNLQLRQDLRYAKAVNTLLQAPDTRLISLQGTDVTPPSGRLIINLEQRKLALVARNLPEPPPGYIYQLWAVIGNEKLPCGELPPPSSRVFAIAFDITPEMLQDFSHPNLSALMVTVEASVNPPRPLGPVILESVQI